MLKIPNSSSCKFKFDSTLSGLWWMNSYLLDQWQKKWIQHSKLQVLFNYKSTRVYQIVYVYFFVVERFYFDYSKK